MCGDAIDQLYVGLDDGGPFAQVVLFLCESGAFVRAHCGKSLRCVNVNANNARLFQKIYINCRLKSGCKAASLIEALKVDRAKDR